MARMVPNPYESPREQWEGIASRVTASRARIPLAVVCIPIAILHAASFPLWLGKLWNPDIVAGDFRIAGLFSALCFVGAIGFSAISFGLLAKKPQIVFVGFVLFLGTVIGQVVVNLLPIF